MSTERKPITVYGHDSPNLSSVQILLKELGIAHDAPKEPSVEDEHVDYLAVNPWGGGPYIQDHNNQITLGEVVAIFEYLVSNYDKEHRLFFRRGTPEFWFAKQWLCFHTSVQGPIFEQARWFKKSHGEKLPGAIGHYVKEVNRVTGVLESQLAKQEQRYPSGDGPWVTGDKLSFVDISLISWQMKICTILGKDEYDVAKFPHVRSWVEKLSSRPSAQGIL